MNDRSPWAPPTPPTRSLAWDPPKPIVPTRITGSGYPEGYLERLKAQGFRIPGEPERPFIPDKRPRPTRKAPTKKRRKAKLKTRIKRKLSPKRYLKRKAKRILKKRILLVPAGTRYNAPKKRLDLGSLRGAKPGQHTKACRAASMVGGRVDHRAIRTPGCPGCNALGPVKSGRR